MLDPTVTRSSDQTLVFFVTADPEPEDTVRHIHSERAVAEADTR
jgi:hypothetical protein